jgi:hypothetical protein
LAIIGKQANTKLVPSGIIIRIKLNMTSKITVLVHQAKNLAAADITGI